MRLDFDKTLTNLDGGELQDETKQPVKLKAICVNALLATDGRDQPSGEDKAKRYILATKLYGGGEQDIALDDASLIKKLVGSLYGPMIVGQVFALLDA